MTIHIDPSETNILQYLEELEYHITEAEVDVYMTKEQEQGMRSQIQYRMLGDESTKFEKLQHGNITYTIITS